MPQTHVQLLRGPESNCDSFTGLPGEITVNQTSNALRIHDGSTVGGHGTICAVHVDDGMVPTVLPKDWREGTLIVEGDGIISSSPAVPSMTYPELTTEHKVGTLGGKDVFSQTFVCTAGNATNTYNTIKSFDGTKITCIKGVEGAIINDVTGEEESLFDIHWNIGSTDPADTSYVMSPCVVRKFNGGLYEYHTDPAWNGKTIYATITYIKP